MNPTVRLEVIGEPKLWTHCSPRPIIECTPNYNEERKEVSLREAAHHIMEILKENPKKDFLIQFRQKEEQKDIPFNFGEPIKVHDIITKLWILEVKDVQFRD